MLSSLARAITSGSDGRDQIIVKVDPLTGLSEFPEPGDTRKHLLPILIDPEEVVVARKEGWEVEKATDSTVKDFWMPDKFCKVCYGCEDAFTMYRRRHHCRMCGQVFCNQCSSFYIDGALINLQGPVRSCRLCHDQLFERSFRDKPVRRGREAEEAGRLASSDLTFTLTNAKPGTIHEYPSLKLMHTNNLQKRFVDSTSVFLFDQCFQCLRSSRGHRRAPSQELGNDRRQADMEKYYCPFGERGRVVCGSRCAWR